MVGVATQTCVCALRIVLDDAISSYKDPLDELNMISREDRCLQDTLVLVYKCVNGLMHTYVSSRFMERNSKYDGRCERKESEVFFIKSKKIKWFSS